MPELTSKENVSLLDVREIHTIRVVEHIKDIIVPNFIQKDVEVPKYREVEIDRPVIVEKRVTVEKIQMEDITKAVAEAAIEQVKQLISSIQLKVIGDGTIKIEVK